VTYALDYALAVARDAGRKALTTSLALHRTPMEKLLIALRAAVEELEGLGLEPGTEAGTLKQPAANFNDQYRP
jgi:hypothetical protein